MNNCNCNGLLPLIFGYFTGRNSANCCGCGDDNIMPINNNNCGMNNCWWIILLLLACCGCGNGCGCGCNNQM